MQSEQGDEVEPGGTGGCEAVASPGPAEATQTDAIQQFFYLVNQTGVELCIRVLADGRVLFVRALPATVHPVAGMVHPPPGPQPTDELKVAISRGATRLEVEELSSLGLRYAVDITGFSQAGRGFSIVVHPDRIEVTQDYLPPR